MRTRVVADLAAAASDEIAVTLRAGGALVLSGGRTPAPVYRQLARRPLDWRAIDVFWSDERCVPPEHTDSNARMARETLLDAVAAPGDRVHRIEGERGAEDAARLYEREIRRVLGEAPVFDLVLLGLGADGHTASLFPGATSLDELRRLVVPARAPQAPVERVSLSLPALARARRILFLVAGPDKAQAVRRVARGELLPAARVRPLAGAAEWLLDEDAARELT